jgi:signal transduction histidine kinase
MALKPIDTTSLKPIELKTIYEISRVILQAGDTAEALKKIVYLARPVFIFDNVILYQPQADFSLTPTYARAVGRGRSKQADLNWGEMIALEVLQTESIVDRQEQIQTEPNDRLNWRFFLGLPLWVDENICGSLVFIRFGGPEFLPEQINLARLIAEHIEHLLQRQLLASEVGNLEAKRKLDRLQQEFVATISHNLRTPLGFIKGYATTLLRDEINWDADTRREFLGIIDEEADRLSEMIDNMLDSSRLQTGTLQLEFHHIRLDSLLQDFVQRVLLSDLNFKLQTNIETANHTVYLDPTRMMQVFDNLVTNAVKYAPGSAVTINLVWSPEKACISVHDSGPGIPAGELENVFQRFYRLTEYKDTAKGNGLGLYICRQIIRAHQGEIFAESSPGEGTTFHIHLPRQPELETSADMNQETKL